MPAASRAGRFGIAGAWFSWGQDQLRLLWVFCWPLCPLPPLCPGLGTQACALSFVVASSGLFPATVNRVGDLPSFRLREDDCSKPKLPRSAAGLSWILKQQCRPPCGRCGEPPGFQARWGSPLVATADVTTIAFRAPALRWQPAHPEDTGRKPQ